MYIYIYLYKYTIYYIGMYRVGVHNFTIMMVCYRERNPYIAAVNELSSLILKRIL